MSDLSVLESFISSALQQAIGDPTTAGLIILFFFLIVMAVLTLDLTVGLLIVFPLMGVLALEGYFPVWVFGIVAIILGLIIAFAGKKLFFTQQ